MDLAHVNYTLNSGDERPFVARDTAVREIVVFALMSDEGVLEVRRGAKMGERREIAVRCGSQQKGWKYVEERRVENAPRLQPIAARSRVARE